MKRSVTKKSFILVLLLSVFIFWGCGEEKTEEKPSECESCETWQVCSDNVCVAKENMCGTDEDCKSDELCIEATNECIVKCTEGETKCEEDKAFSCVNNIWEISDCSLAGEVCMLSENIASCIKPECKELVADLHVADNNYIDLTTYSMADVDNCDFIVAKSGSGPMIYLCEGVKAYNNGNLVSFLDLTQAPSETHIPDTDTEKVIGSSWRDEGSGETGFPMTQNIYTIERKDGSFAKLEVLSSIAGKITMSLYTDIKGGNNLKCFNIE